MQLEVFEKMDILECMQAFALWRSRWHVILLFLLWGLTPAVWANGNKEATYKEAKGSQTFSGTIDLTDQKAGTYNVVIKTTDQAGNVTYSTPFNIINDPDSALPVVTLATPEPNQRIRSSVNIVGAATATEGVGRVEVRIDGGDWKVASGKAFWSYKLDLSTYADGPHEVEVRGFDVHNLEGRTQRVPFITDQFKPGLTVVSHPSGERVSGELDLKGTLTDGNGLASMSWSTDGAATWKPIEMPSDPTAKSRDWQVHLNSRLFPDGPVVLWFKGIDRQGSESRLAFLLLADNTPPILEVLSPKEEAGVHGIVRFAGKVTKKLGIASLTAQIGKNTAVKIPVLAGNPFWSVDLDLSKEVGPEVAVTFEATDTAGAKGFLTVRRKLERETSLPTLILKQEIDKSTFNDPMTITGTLRAPDGPSAVAWSLNGGPEKLQSVGASFSFLLPGMLSGTNKLTLTPVDQTQKRGSTASYTFTGILPKPEISLVSLFANDMEIPFTAGMKVAPEKKNRIRVSLTSPNQLKELTWSLADGEPMKLIPVAAKSGFSADLIFPADPPFGVVAVKVTAADVYGQVFTASSFINVLNYSKPQGPEGLAFVDARIGSNPLFLTPETPLLGYFSGGNIRTIEILITSRAVATVPVGVSFDGQVITLKALKDGRIDGAKLHIVTDKGRVFDTDFGSILSDVAPPAVGLSSPLPGAWSNGLLKIDGQVSDSGGLAKFEWSVDNGVTWAQLDLPVGNTSTFSRTITLPGPDDVVNLLLRATDKAGREARVLTVVRRDTQAPEIDLAVPLLDSKSKGTVLVSGRFTDEGAVARAEVQLDRKVVALPIDRPFTLNLDLATYLSTPVKIRVFDVAGNQAEKLLQLSLETPPAPSASTAAAPIPALQILFPTPERKGLNGTLPITGRIIGFDAVPQLNVRGEGLAQKPLTLTDAGYFTVDVDVSAWKDRSLIFTASNSNKQTATLTFKVPYDDASDLPVARFLPRTEKMVLTGNVTASGWIGDDRGVVSWSSQLDGNPKVTTTPDPAKPPLGSFLVDLGVPPLGSHKLTVFPLDAGGKEGKPISVEFTSTSMSGPVQFSGMTFGAAVAVTKDTRIQGKVPSPNSWKRLEYRIADFSQPDWLNGPFLPLLPVKDKVTENTWNFEIPTPLDLPYARIAVVVRGEDSLGQLVEGRTLFHRIWPKDAAQVYEREGILFADNRIGENGKVELLPGATFSGTFRGSALKSVTLVPPVAGLDLQLSGDRILLSAKEEGLYGPFTVSALTVDNEKYSSQTFTLFFDGGGPSIDVSTPQTGDWIRGSVQVEGKITEPSGLVSSEVSVDSGQTWSKLVVNKGVFSVKLPVTGPDGLVGIRLRATDRGGHVSSLDRWVTNDGGGPAIAIVTPPEGLKVNGLTTIVGTATDLGGIGKIEFSDDGKTYKLANGTDTFQFQLDFASYAKLPEKWSIRATDLAGNVSVTPVAFAVDQEADKPVVQIQTPANGEVVRSDFKITGMVFDDDGVKSVSWRIDGGPWTKLDNVTSFSIAQALSTLKDNEHRIEMQAEDIYGTKSNVFTSTFRVSLAPPVSVLLAPEIQKTANGVVSLIGAGLDRNGIKSVAISLDNGLSWNRAEFRPKEDLVLSPGADPQVKEFLPKERREWEWRFDTKTLKDGTYSVLIRTTDAYDSESIYTSLLNLDNTFPQLTLNSPTDGQPLLDALKLEGRSSDNVNLQSLKAMLRLIEATATVSGVASSVSVSSNTVQVYDLPVTPVFNQEFPLDTLTPGWYNLRLEGRDAAGNTTYIARNVQIGSAATFDKVEVLYPLSGETRNGMFLIAGKVTSHNKVEKASILIDGKSKTLVDIDEKGYFQLEVFGDLVESGEHVIQAVVQLNAAVKLSSEPRKVIFEAEGPYVQVTSTKNGAFVTNRPYIEGVAGWMAVETLQDVNKLDPTHAITSVEVSLDNGKSFTTAVGTANWKYRLESLELPDGALPLVFRARFADGSAALQRMIVNVRQTATTVNMTKSLENTRVYGKVELSGYTSDPTGQSKVEIALREGDKANYGAPTFIQGLYMDTHLWGATWWEQAVGFSFSNEAVKLQAQIGQAPPDSRFSGTIAGIKLIATVANIPFQYFFGPDWDWLSQTVALGADFSLFSNTTTFLDFSGKEAPSVFLGSLLVQWELAKITLRNQTFFRTYSWYGELTTWFISSEVQATVVPSFSTGLRVGIW